jgi:hypothetical protein
VRKGKKCILIRTWENISVLTKHEKCSEYVVYIVNLLNKEVIVSSFLSCQYCISVMG